MKALKEFLESHFINFEQDIDLKKRTWIHRGGICRFFIEPESLEKIELISHYLFEKSIDFDVIGHTSNIWFSNDYSPNVILSTRKIQKIYFEDNFVVAYAGSLMTKLSSFCVENGIAGFEGFVDLPGTIGGAVCNNSGCFGSEIDKVLEKIEVITPNGKKIIETQELGYSHRNSNLKNKNQKIIVIRAFFKKSTVSDMTKLKQKSELNHHIRKQTQCGPLQNLGSVFAKLQRKSYKTIIRENGLKIGFSYIIIYNFWGVIKKITRNKIKISKKRKDSILKLFNFSYLASYISDSDLNRFIWSDEKADALFSDYCNFMDKIFEKKRLEIEIR